jgi:hypothetical protein
MFALIAEELRGANQRVMVSIVDFYRKTDRRLSQLEKEEGYTFDRNVVGDQNTSYLLKDLAESLPRQHRDIHMCGRKRL